MDPAELPGDQDAEEEGDRQGDANREGSHHVAALRAPVAAAANHEDAGEKQGAKDRREGDTDKQVHGERLSARRGADRGGPVTDAATRPSSPLEPAASRWRGVVVLLVALAGVALAVRLGFWQLDRAAQKQALQAQLEARASEAVLAAPELARRPETAAAQADRRVRLGGRWAVGRTVYLDNRQMDGKVGFDVVTPLLLDDSREAILVQRGWVQRNFDERAALPAIDTPAGYVEVEGTLAPPPPRLFEFSAVASGAIRQNIDPASFARETGLALLPLAVLESATPANSHDGLARHWPPPSTGVQMHYGYAFQWFAIGTVIAFLYVWLRIVRPRQRRRP